MEAITMVQAKAIIDVAMVTLRKAKIFLTNIHYIYLPCCLKVDVKDY
jgi:hypothetical protein